MYAPHSGCSGSSWVPSEDDMHTLRQAYLKMLFTKLLDKRASVAIASCEPIIHGPGFHVSTVPPGQSTRRFLHICVTGSRASGRTQVSGLDSE